jgi:hypothetical protein
MSCVVDKIVVAVTQAKNGVSYDTKKGAVCPFCGQRVRVTHTHDWLDNSRKRYHKCVNPDCPLHKFDETITSWQEV